jgi:hypothetical protein
LTGRVKDLFYLIWCALTLTHRSPRRSALAESKPFALASWTAPAERSGDGAFAGATLHRPPKSVWCAQERRRAAAVQTTSRSRGPMPVAPASWIAPALTSFLRLLSAASFWSCSLMIRGIRDIRGQELLFPFAYFVFRSSLGFLDWKHVPHNGSRRPLSVVCCP